MPKRFSSLRAGTCKNAPFPLTPALSLGERENRSPLLECLSAAEFSLRPGRFTAHPNDEVATECFRTFRGRPMRSPLPEGEGKGEGERTSQSGTATFSR